MNSDFSLAHCPPSPARMRGMGLMEILIALLVVAVGLLGIASLQFMSKRSSFEALQRTTASMLAQDIVERMRANYKGLDSYAGTLEATPIILGGGTITSPPTPCTFGAPCPIPADVAAYDLWEWEQAIDGVTETDTDTAANTGGLTLPTGCLYSKVSSAAADRSGNYIVAIVWRGPTDMANPVNPANPIPAPDPYTCGEGSGKYDGENGTDSQRRILVVEVYINAPL
jgi:type IV pilus assembly protein PilV